MKKNQQKYLILIGFMLVIVVHHLLGYLGHYGYDDMHYAKLAHKLSLGEFSPQNHFSFRLTLLGLTALSYKLFGVSDFASALPSMLSFIATLILVFVVLKKEKPAIIAIGLTFFSLNLWGLFYSDKLMPDSFVTFFTFLNLFFIYTYKYRNKTLSVFFYALAAAFSLFLGFNTKGNIVLIFPLLAYLFITDLRLRRDLKFWFSFIGISLFLLVSYFSFYHFLYGNAWIRFQSIAENSYLNLCSYSEQPFLQTLKRIGYQLFLLFVSHALITPFIFLFSSSKQLFKKDILHFNSEASFFTLAAFILLLSSNFMTISLSGYSPMCLDPRHYLFIVPVAGIAATLKIKENLSNKVFWIQALLVTIVVLAVALINKNDTSWLLYFPIFLAILLFLLLKKKYYRVQVFVILLFVALVINPTQNMRYAQKVNFREQEVIMKELVQDLEEPALIVTNPVQKDLIPYLNKFKTTDIHFLSYNEFDNVQKTENRTIYLFKNYYTRYLSGLKEQQLPFYARITENYEKLYENSDLDIQFFRIDTLSISKKVLETQNNFEKNNEKWSNYQRSKKYVHSGIYSSLVSKYSSTFKLSLDTINIHNAQQLIVSSTFYILLAKESDVSFVVSSKSGLWKGYSLKNQVKAYGSWLPITISEVIDLKTIPTNDVFSFYVLNPDEEEVYIDDFSIQLSVLNYAENK